MSWLALCDRCGFKYTNTKLRKEWTGLMTCDGPDTNHCWEARHPQDFVRAVKDKQSPPYTRPTGASFAMSTILDSLGRPILDSNGQFIEDSNSTTGVTFLSPGDVTEDDL